MTRVLRVGAYVKLAKLWEKRRDDAVAYHRTYYSEKYAGKRNRQLVDVYIDITGSKEIRNRPSMLKLLKDCCDGSIDCIVAQTSGYLAANTKEFCYLLKYLFDMEPWIELVTEDTQYSINTITDDDNQRESLQRMADSFVRIDPASYEEWKEKVEKQMRLLAGE